MRPKPPTNLATPVQDPAFRAGDRDRDKISSVLSDAYAKGYLNLGEFEQRSEQVLAARTMGELRPLVADLPTPQPERRGVQSSQRSDLRAARTGVKAHAMSYGFAMLIMVGIWAVTAVLFGATYFWPIWPALGWGIGVASHALPVLRATALTAGGRPGPAQLPR